MCSSNCPSKVLGRNGTSGVTVDEKIANAVSYGEFHCGSFELVPRNFRRSDPAIFEFQNPTAVILLNGPGHQKKKFSDLAENGTNRLDDIKSGANLPSDYFFDFLKNHVSEPGCPSGPISPRDLDVRRPLPVDFLLNLKTEQFALHISAAHTEHFFRVGEGRTRHR